MGTFAQDVRFGFRMLLRTPGMTAVAVVTLALGIGANTTVFSWISALLLDPLPAVPAAESLVSVELLNPDGSESSFSYPEYLDYRDGGAAVAGLTVFDMQAMNLGGDPAERVWGAIVSADHFDVLQVKPQIGRTFVPAEGSGPGAHPVVVISDGLWRRRFGGDPSIAGTDVTLNNRTFTVIGVTPPGFQGAYVGLALDAWVPLMMQEAIVPGGSRLDQRGNHWLDALARLRPDVPRAQAQAALGAVAARLHAAEGGTGRPQTVLLTPLWRTGAGEFIGPLLLMLLGIVGVVLLIACANVANLMLARVVTRRRETAIRLAMGAGRLRLIRQFLTESLLLASLGGIGGWVMALWSAGALRALIPPTEYPIAATSRLDTTVLLFTVAATCLAALMFGLAPALQASHAGLMTGLKEESMAAGGGVTRTRLRSMLVVAQVALSLLLLICAGLFIRSLSRARALDPGFNPRGVLLASLDLFPNGYDTERGRLFYRQLLERVATIPGVESATMARKVPLSFQGTSSFTFQVEGHDAAPDQTPWAFYNNVGPGYFRTLQVPMLAGRDIETGDDPDSPRVAVVNETLAGRYWPGGQAIGGRIHLGGDWYTVVGIARDQRYKTLSEPPSPYLFLPAGQAYRSDTTLHVRSSLDPESLAAALRREIETMDRNLPVFGVRTLEAGIGAAMLPQRLGGLLLGTFGLLALGMASIGIYGVLAFSVGQRLHEVGVRLAMGARSGDILGLIVKEGMTLALAGVGIGLAAALALTRFLRGFLFGVGPADPITFASLAVFLISIALLACWLPARRAARVDPMAALRHE